MNEDGSAELQALYGQVYERMKALLTAKELAPRDNSSGQPVWKNELRYALRELKNKGYVTNPRREVWGITDKGRDWLGAHPEPPR